MALTTQVSYIGKGEVFLQKRNSAGAKQTPIGNCTSLQFGITEDTKELLDYTSAGGGKLDTSSRIKAVTAKMKVSNLSPSNLAIALRGSVTTHAAAAVADEAHADIVRGSLVELARLPDTGAAITVKVGATVVAAAGNWQAMGAGIWIEPTATALADGDDITVTYGALADDLVQAMVSSSDEYTLLFQGLNEARSGKPVIVKAFRIKFSPAKALDLIADEFGQLELEAEALSDATVTGTGLSKFMSVRMAQQAA
jgi:hypothetical protein